MKTRILTSAAFILLTLSFTISYPPITVNALEITNPKISGHSEDGGATVNGTVGDGESDPVDTPHDHDPADDIPPLTNEADLDPASVSYKQAVPCKQVFLGKAANSPIVSDDATVDDCLRAGQIRTRAVLPQHETFYISLRLSFEPTVLVSINVHSGCHTRTNTFPPSLQSRVPHKPIR